MDSFTLSRNWFNFSFDNPDKVNPNHAALYFFIIEHCNRLGGKEKFGLPMEMAKEAIGIKNYRTYAKTFQDLVDWNFIKIIQKSKNQYSSNVIAIVINAKAPAKALDKALQKHSQSHSQKQGQGIVGIDKQETTNKKKLKNKEYAQILNDYCLKFFDAKYVNEKSLIMFDKLLNEYKPDQISKAIENGKSDTFWNNQFLSPLKLQTRNKENVLYIDKFLSLKGNKLSKTEFERLNDI